jgi:hypothetical protein
MTVMGFGQAEQTSKPRAPAPDAPGHAEPTPAGPGLTELEALPGAPDPQRLARLLESYPQEREALLRVFHERFGNAVVGQVLAQRSDHHVDLADPTVHSLAVHSDNPAPGPQGHPGHHANLDPVAGPLLTWAP